jgi:TRAP transporter TAXI family solute receptor
MKRLKIAHWMVIFFVCGLTFSLLPTGDGLGAEPSKLPKVIGITTNPMGTAYYTCTAALAQTIKQVTGMEVRLFGTNSDIERVTPLQSKEYHLAYDSIGSAVPTSLGWALFSRKNLGPQPIRLLWLSAPGYAVSFVRANSGIKTWNDLKGKRVGYTPGYFSLNTQILAMLAFGGLTPDDVKLTTMPNIPNLFKGPLDGTTDWACGMPTGSYLYELAGSPHGVHYLQFAPSDKGGWRRLKSVASYFVPTRVEKGPGIKAGEHVYSIGCPTVLFCYDWLDENLVYTVSKALYSRSDIYMGMSAEFRDFSRERSINMEGIVSYNVPFHAGFIKYLKEEGTWTAEYEKWQNEQLKNEKERMATWKAGHLIVYTKAIDIAREAAKRW